MKKKNHGRRYHERPLHEQQNAECEPYKSYYYGGYHTAAVAAGYAPSYYAPAAYSTPNAASNRMPRETQYYFPQPRSLQGFTPHLDGVRSSAICQLPHPDEEERSSDFSDENEAGELKSEWRDKKAGPRKTAPVSLFNEKEARELQLPFYSEITSMSTHLPPVESETVKLKAEKAAKVAYERLLIEKRGVTVWKIVQAMLLQLNSDSLEALGLSLHNVPSLRKLVILEGKINTYIHCHVAVRRITTLHELSQEISQNEGVKDFEDLKLGPISFHPLVCQYFAFPAGLQVCKISTEDVLGYLSEYMNKHLGNIQMDDFLSFTSKARSLPSPQHLGVRLQSFGMYISFLRREKKVERAFANQRASLVAVKETALKQEMPRHSITSRIDAFLASAAAEGTQHTLSSDNEDATNALGVKKKSTLVSTHLQQNSCPYPSAAEERDRLCTKSLAEANVESQKTAYDLSKRELGDFVAAWRGFIQKSSVSDVLMQMLANGRSSKKKKKKLAKLFKEYPAIGILNIAVVSMKAGHWNSLYDAFEEAATVDLNDTKEGTRSVEGVDRMEIVSEEPQRLMSNHGDSTTDHACLSIDALNEVLMMLENLPENSSNKSEASTAKLTEEEEFCVTLERILKCEKILLEQLVPKSVKSDNFKDRSDFIGLYLNKLSRILVKFQPKKLESDLDFILPVNRVKNFLYQLSVATNDFDGFPENRISQLLAEQFNLVNSQCCLNMVKRHVQALQSVKATSLLFYSRALLTTKTDKMSTGPSEVNCENRENVVRAGLLGNLTSVDARNCLLKAPMLCNILEWSQWDAVFSPTLGPLLEWLERENSVRELVCLVTSQGSILRIDGSATVESLLAVAVRGLGKETALQLISLVGTYGGADKVPRALLKSYLSKAIELLVENKSKAHKKRRTPSVVYENDCTKRAKHLLSDDAGSFPRKIVDNFIVEMPFDKFSGAVQFVLELFMDLPSEFVVYVSTVVVPALCGIVPNAPVAMLNLCSSNEHRMRLHEVGLASGITEWVRDFQTLFVESPSPFKREITQIPTSDKLKDVLTKTSPLYSPEAGPLIDVSDNASTKEDLADCYVAFRSPVENLGYARVSESGAPDNKESIEGQQEREANEVISLIRKEEFGMDLELTSKEQNLLAKQHARMGRALKCLSRELYSQDSHYVLELVQNADDNQYGADVAAMLVFMLQQERVVVVNNELGFTPANMKALCDVGNSTKTGSAAGYIGQKGIGFKSVFRITDSPQIHSKGFHVKFDISEGNIGFVLPTVIPPFSDWHKLDEVLSLTESLTSQGKQTWNTCMVFPLKDKVVNGPDIETLSTRFGDVHPSLLLFLRQLCSITIKDDIRGTMRVMQRYDMDDGLVRVSDNESVSHWLVIKQKLDAVLDPPRVKTTEIALAFPLQEVSPGEFEACNEYQQVFSFLPLRSYGLRFIVQGDFVLPSSREDLDTDCPWNQWLLSEIPSVCVKALEAFKRLSCSKEDAGKAASMFLSFLPLEGEVQGFFSSLPRMIFLCLRTSACLPIEGTSGEWALPCIVLGGWSESVRNLLPAELLWELLGLCYLHRKVHLPSVLASELGIHLYGSRVLVDFLESLCSRKDVLEKMGARWISLWLVALHRCISSESQRQTQVMQCEVADHAFKRLQNLPFIPLSNGTYTSVEDGPLWLPSVDATSATGKSGLLRQFPLLYSELRTVDALLLFPDCIISPDLTSVEQDMLAVGSEERSQVYSVLRRLGTVQISEHKVVTLHVLPSMTSENACNKSDLLLMQSLAFVMVHLQSECDQCKTEGLNILNDLKKNAIIVTSRGRKRVNEEPLHFGVEFGCPVDVRKLLLGLQMSWTEVDAAYLQTFQGWSEEMACLKWRSFFKELGVTDFVKLELVEKNLHDKAASIWMEISLEGCNDGSNMVTIKDWECPEAVQILEILCNPSFDNPQRLFKCAQFLSLFDLMWEESYSEYEATYWRHSSSGTQSKRTTLPSFILLLRSFPWIQSSFDGKLYHPKELFHQCSAVESLLGNNVPYAKPQLNSSKLAVALGLQTVVSAPAVLHVFKLWNQVPIHISVEQMTKLYTWLWNEMGDDKGIRQFLQTESSIFVPQVALEKSNGAVLGRFVCPKNVVWRDETECLSLILPTNNVSSEKVLCRALNTLYPMLQPFFVNECLVRDTLCFKGYYSVLRIVAETFSPQTVLDKVLKVFARWSDSIKSGEVSSTNISEWRELFQKADSQVFPTVQNKWVSLHSGEGILCWCDDEALGKMFLGSKGIHYMCVDMAASNSCFGRGHETTNVNMLGPFLQAMNILPLSKVVEREPIAYGAQRSKQLMQLLNWAVPYVQRYLQKMHPNVYKRLQKAEIRNSLNKFTCVVCNQLFFRYKLPGEFCTTSERLECSYLLEDDVFYAAHLDDLNSLFLEFSKVFFDRVPNVQLANFLHLITLSVQSGSNETAIEALLVSQGITSTVEGDAEWMFSFSDCETLPESAKKLTEPYVAYSAPPRKAKSFFADTWPPRSLQQHRSPHAHRLAVCQSSLDAIMKEIEIKKGRKPGEPGSSSSQTADDCCDRTSTEFLARAEIGGNQVSFSDREQLAMGQPSEQHQEMTGRLGEAVVFKHLLEKHGPELVKWMNAETESGLPYDIVIEGKDGQQKLVEVKSTWSEGKDWFEMSQHEWELACRLGDRFVIVRVFLSGGSSARFLWLPDPSQLCQQRLIKLALVLPRHDHGHGL